MRFIYIFFAQLLYSCHCGITGQVENVRESISISPSASDTAKNPNSIFSEQVKNLGYYEIVIPAEFSSAHLEGSESESSFKHIQISAFNTSYDINIIKNEYNLSQNIFVDYFGKNNSYEGKIVDGKDCIYTGHARTFNNESADVILNVCDGLEGFIHAETDTIFIEPLKVHAPTMESMPRKHIIYRKKDIKNIRSTEFDDIFQKEPFDMPHRAAKVGSNIRVRRSGYDSFLNFKNRANRRVQLYYLDSFGRERAFPPRALYHGESSGVNTFIGTIWIVKDEKTNTPLLLNGKNRYEAKRSRVSRRAEIVITESANVKLTEKIETNEVDGSERYIEVMVVIDESVTNFHGKKKVEKYIFTMMKLAALILKDKTLGVHINFQLVRLVIIDNAQTGFKVYVRNPTRTLVSACNYVATLQNNDKTHRDHFDFAVVLTRKDFGPSGYAQLYSMCTRKRSCVIVQDEGFTSAFIVAHETGHLLGLEHDGEGEARKCDQDSSKGSIMAATIVSKQDQFYWSTCSKNVLQQNIGYFDCLLNIPNQRAKCAGSCDAPYTLSEQCQLNFGSAYTACTAWTFNPCQRLWCQNPTKLNSCHTNRSPALDGSMCGRNRHCSRGECINDEESVMPNTPATTRKTIVHGNWGSWHSWSSCSQSCGVGIRRKTRKCDSPKPGPNGLSCVGTDVEKDLCNTAACSIVKSFNSIRKEQCIDLNSKGWRLYTDGAFEIRLQQSQNNLNCSFEDGFCNWKNSLNNDMDWNLNEGKTQSYKTGPSNDHTFKNEQGKYIFIEASISYKNDIEEGDVARLISPTIRIPRICFGVSYHMYGRDMGGLRVKLLFANNTEREVWSKSGNQGDMWKSIQLSIESFTDYRIVIEASRGVHWASDVAVDDISAAVGLCPNDKKDQNPCRLSCRSRDARSFKMDLNVKDGTKCYSNRVHDVCDEGECKKFGCDNKFGSDLMFDDCMLCGGDGSTCVRKTGRVEKTPSEDYETFLILPKGSTFINLTEHSYRPHYFGLRRMSHTSVYLSTKYEDYFSIDDTSFHFKKDANGRQQIFALGPTQRDMDVVVYTFANQRTRELSLNYEFFAPPTEKSTYQYKIKSWQPCSRSCGTGKQQSVAACTRRQDLREVGPRNCRHQKKPLYIRSCKLQECPQTYKWVLKDWSECSKTCGLNATKTRVVECLNVFENVLTTLANCPLPAPSTSIKCDLKLCPRVYKWSSNKWTSCSKSCGSGTRSRIVRCLDEETDRTVNGGKCDQQKKPDDLGPCNIQECDTFVWSVREEGKCSKTCGGGFKVRIVYCINEKTKLYVDNKYCDGPSPQRIASCNEQQCPEYAWHVVESSPCSVTCGNGTLSRTIECVNEVDNQHVAENKCLAVKPPVVSTCFERRCLSSKVSYTEWSKCSAVCGVGVQKRDAYCVTFDYRIILSSNKCEGELTVQRSCNKLPCANSDDLSCNFESETFCNWMNIQSDNFDWSIGKTTPSVNTGPLNDHTTNTGYFAYIEASKPRERGQKAQLSSMHLKIKRGCLVFWYHMRGPSIGQLRVYVISRFGERVAFVKDAHQGRNWLQAKIPTNETEATSGYSYMIEATVGFSVYGDIAIDDLEFHESSCEEVPNAPVKMIVPKNCREVSPYCSHAMRRRYCLESKAYRALCCKTCSSFLP